VGAGGEPLTPLKAAVEEAYRVFKAEAPERWSGDDIGVGKEDWERLSTVPLRELTRSDTYHFLTETGVFNRHEVRYMLPRILDLLAAGEEPHAAGDECSLSCLANAGYPEQWTAPERAAIDAFFFAMLDACLEDEEFWERWSLDTLLCVAGCANADVGALLARADRAEDQRLARAVAHDIDWVGGLYPAGGLVNAFWQSARPEHAAAVDAWYRHPELLARVERAFFDESDPDWQKRISDAVEAMRGWRTS
jgi:hypothetical protein